MKHVKGMSRVKVFLHRNHPELAEKLGSFGDLWMELVFHTEKGDLYYHHVWDTFADFNFYLGEDEDHLVAAGICMPLYWDGNPDSLPTGWDDVLELGVKQHEEGIAPNTVSALAAMVSKDHQGQGLSKYAIRTMKGLAKKHGLYQFIAPVRPTRKSMYPLTPMDRYMRWMREDGSPFDPWLRVHCQEGGTIVKAAVPSMTTKGTVAQFEQWTKMRFPESGTYVVPGALDPIVIDREADTGLYEESNVWVVCSDIRDHKSE